MRWLRFPWCFSLAFFLFLAGMPLLANSDNPPVEEGILRDAGIGINGPALLEFLHKRTLDEVGLAKIHRLVKQLGDRSFSMREQASNELVGLGKPASPFLRRACARRP